MQTVFSQLLTCISMNVSISSSRDDDDKTEHETSIVGGALRNVFRTFARVFRVEKVVFGSLPRRVPTRAIAKSADTLGQVHVDTWVDIWIRMHHLSDT